MSLIGTLSVSLAIAGVTTAVVVWKRRWSTARPAESEATFEESIVDLMPEVLATPLYPPDLPQQFGYKISWLAVKDVEPSQVCEAMNLKDVQEMGWETGLKLAYRDHIFVSPKLGEWVLVAGYCLPSIGGERHPNLALPFAKALSAKLDTVVQSFGSHRGVAYFHWIWAEKGQIRRFYGTSDGYEDSEGEPTPAEIELDIVFPVAEVASDDDDEDVDYRFANEEDVLMLAEKWSINPGTLGLDGVRVGTGWVGLR